MLLHYILYVLMLIFIFLYECCVSYQIETDHVAHIMTHYLKITIEELRNDIDVFTKSNMKWIRKVAETFFRNLDGDVYLKELVQGVCNFDAMAILLACVSHNIHALCPSATIVRGENEGEKVRMDSTTVPLNLPTLVVMLLSLLFHLFYRLLCLQK